MRVASHLAFAVFSLGAVAAPSTAPNATNQTVSWMSAAQQHAVIDAARSIAVDPPLETRSPQESPADSETNWGTSIGETLPEKVELHSIPRHETYRYAVVNDHRVIVDAASRRIVYIIN
jgi:uncharacterized protein DUF1236